MTTSRITEEQREMSWGSLFIIYKSTNKYKSEDSWADWLEIFTLEGHKVCWSPLVLSSWSQTNWKWSNWTIVHISVSQSLFFRSNDNFRLYDSFMKLSQCGKIEITRQAQSQNWIEAIYSKGRVGYIEGGNILIIEFEMFHPWEAAARLLEIKPSIIQQSRGKLD